MHWNKGMSFYFEFATNNNIFILSFIFLLAAHTWILTLTWQWKAFWASSQWLLGGFLSFAQMEEATEKTWLCRMCRFDTVVHCLVWMVFIIRAVVVFILSLSFSSSSFFTVGHLVITLSHLHTACSRQNCMIILPLCIDKKSIHALNCFPLLWLL